MEEPVSKASVDGAAAETDGSRSVHSRDSERSPPHKARKIDTTNRGDDGRGRRPRKGDAKRERKRKALEEAAQMCQYYNDEHGLRRVRPYTYNFETHAKERWLGRTVIDVFSAEFGANPRSYYERAIRGGLLTVNSKTISPDFKLRNSDLVCNKTHRHEPPVTGGDIVIVSESADEVVVDKPCTIPIHPCGAYRFNTLFYILQHQRPDLTLRVCHRLDRLTSGLTIIAKTSERASVIQKQIGSGKTRKTYVARVSGDFGQNLPANRRQTGSPLTRAAAAASPAPAPGSPSATESTGGDAKGASSLPKGVTSSGEEGDAPATAVGVDSGLTPPVSKSDGGGALPPVTVTAGELWWRYEPAGEGVVEGRTQREGGDAAVLACGEPGEGLAGSGSASDGVGCGSRERGGGVMVRVNCPIRVLDPKDGVYECHPEGKEAQTVIRKVAYDAASDTSVVECTPVHGRTHQIRLHLQWVGHPIANDPCYGGELFFGNPEAKLRAEQDSSSEGWKGTARSKAAAAAAAAAEAAAAAATSLEEAGAPHREDARTEAVEGGSGNVATDRVGDAAMEGGQEGAAVLGKAEGSSSSADAVPSSSDASVSARGGEPMVDEAECFEAQREDEDDEAFMVRTCNVCQGGERFSENQLHCLGIWLHALRYQSPPKMIFAGGAYQTTMVEELAGGSHRLVEGGEMGGPDWAYETKMPSWASL